MTEPGPYRVLSKLSRLAPTTKQIDVKAQRHTPWGSDDELAVTLFDRPTRRSPQFIDRRSAGPDDFIDAARITRSAV